MTKIAGNPELYELVTALYAGPSFSAPSPDFPPVLSSPFAKLSNPLQVEVDIDTLLIEHICTYNAFYLKDATRLDGYSTDKERFDAPSALYLLPSLFNHACSANTIWYNFGDVMVVRAAKDLAEGEELTLSYLADSKHVPYATRKTELAKHMSQCDCEECEADRNDGEEFCRRRAFYLARLRSMAEISLDATRTLVRNMEENYAPSRGPIRPESSQARSNLVEILADAARELPSLGPEVIAEGIKALEAAGIVVLDRTVSVEVSEVELAKSEDEVGLPIGTSSAPTYDVGMCVWVMLRMAGVFHMGRDMKMAKRWLDAARWGMLILSIPLALVLPRPDRSCSHV